MKHRYSTTIIMLAISLGGNQLALAADKDAPKRANEKWAVLVAVDDYLNAGDLKYCGADQRSLKEQLIKSGFDERQVFLLHDAATDKKLLPFKANIERQLQTVLGFAEPGDFVLVAFSGHGVHFNKVSYLCPTDAKLDDPNSLISMEWLYDKLAKSKADLRLVMVDACRNDPRPEGQRSMSNQEVRDGTRAFVKEAERLPEGIVLLNSCSEGEVSQEDKEFGHGVFMHFVLEGLAGQADKDGDKHVTFNELVRYTSKETKLFVEKRYNDSQRPKLKGNLTGDVLDFELASLSAAPTRLPLPTTPSNSPLRVEVGKTITNGIGMKLVEIPAGEFEMGSSESDIAGLVRDFSDFKSEYADDERPVHRVRITKAYYMGIHEVTLGQFLKFYHEAKYKVECEKDGKGGWGYNAKDKKFEQHANYRPWSWGFEGQTMEHPVVNVTWNDANAFCRWLSEKEGVTYRLPTEAEWEYACRAGTKTRHPAGDQTGSLVRIANVADQSAKTIPGFWDFVKVASFDDGYKFTAPVGSFTPNSFGLYDMIGNVYEWCDDVYDAKAYGSRSGTTKDPVVTSGSENRVLRGGSWDNNPRNARSASRFGNSSPVDRAFVIGFRVVSVGVGVRTP